MKAGRLLFIVAVWTVGCGDDTGAGAEAGAGATGGAGAGTTAGGDGPGGGATTGGGGAGGSGGGPLGGLGDPCTDSAQCASGQCADAVCCDVGCAGLCQSCVAAETGGVDGTCAPIAADTDPSSECEDGVACGTGACDGAGSCGLLPAETLCRASVGACDTAEACTGASLDCPADVLVDAGLSCRAAQSTCDVEELCDGQTADCPADELAPIGTTCGSYLCDAVSAECPTTCSTDSSCAGGFVCLGSCMAGRRVFITSATHDGNLGGLAGGDAFCQALADAQGLGGTFRMWLSDATGSPSTRFVQSADPYYLLNGTMVASSYADLVDGTLLAAINVNEAGGLVASNVPFTGTNSDGTAIQGGGAAQDNCSGWTSAASGNHGWTGNSDGADITWTVSSNSGSPRQCNVLHRFYCFEQ